MNNSIALPIVRHEQQGYFTHRVFVLDGDNWTELSINGSLYVEQRCLRIARIAAELAMFPESEFFPILLFPESWPPEIIQEALKPRKVYNQLGLAVD